LTKEKKDDKEPEEITDDAFNGIMSALLAVPPKKQKSVKKKAGPKKKPRLS